MQRKKSNIIGEKMSSYHYGNPDNSNSWEYAASIFAAHESVASKRTSSLPLVQFWKPNPKGCLSEYAKTFLKECGQSLNLGSSKLCFEYRHQVDNYL